MIKLHLHDDNGTIKMKLEVDGKIGDIADMLYSAMHNEENLASIVMAAADSYARDMMEAKAIKTKYTA